MAFERIALQLGKARVSAGITITQHGKTVVALRKDIVTKAGFKAGASYSVLLGKDEDHGKLRIVLDKEGVPCARELKRNGAFFFKLGLVPAIGTTPAKQRPIDARLIDGGIEIDLPEDPGPKLLAPPAAPAPNAPASDKKATAKPKSPGAVTLNGVTIDLTEDEESITFDGEGIIVSRKEALLVQALARPRPSTVAENFLMKQIFSPVPRDGADQLRRMCAELKKSLAEIGLNLNAVKGVGYQLKDAA